MATKDSVLADVMAAARRLEDGEESAGAEEVGAAGSEDSSSGADGGGESGGGRDSGAHHHGQSEEQAVGDQRRRVPDGPGRVRDASGKFVKGTEKADAQKVQAKDPVVTQKPQLNGRASAPHLAAVPNPTNGQTNGAAQAVAAALRAPANWKPEYREKWSTLPPELQSEIARVDKEFYRERQEGAEARRIRDSFNQVWEPYRAMLGNADPVQATRSLAQWAYIANHGSPQQAAELVANIIKGRSLDINLVAAALDGSAPQSQPQQHVDPNQILQQARAMLHQDLMRAQQHTMAQKEAETWAELEQEAEWLDPVGYDGKPIPGGVRSIMEGLRKGGVVTDIKKAYHAACQLHPEVSEVLRQREANQAEKAREPSIQRSRAASISLKNEPTTVVERKGNRSILEEIQAQAAKLSGGR